MIDQSPSTSNLRVCFASPRGGGEGAAVAALCPAWCPLERASERDRVVLLAWTKRGGAGFTLGITTPSKGTAIESGPRTDWWTAGRLKSLARNARAYALFLTAAALRGGGALMSETCTHDLARHISSPLSHALLACCPTRCIDPPPLLRVMHWAPLCLRVLWLTDPTSSTHAKQHVALLGFVCSSSSPST